MIELPNVTSLYVLLAFGVSYVILKKYLFVPLSGILEAREREEAEAQKAYAESLATLERAVAAGEEKLAAARREGAEDPRGPARRGRRRFSTRSSPAPASRPPRRSTAARRKSRRARRSSPASFRIAR